MEPEALEILQRVLRGGAQALAAEHLQALLRKGALLALAEDGSPEALQAAADAVLFAEPDLASLALRVLEALAELNQPAARAALCWLAGRANHPGARAAALRQGYAPDDPTERALFYLLTGQIAAYAEADPAQEALGAAFARAGGLLRQRILAAAPGAGLGEWAQAAAAVYGSGADPQEQPPGRLAELAARYPVFHNPPARRLALTGLRDLAAAGSAEAGGALCQIFIDTGETAFAEAALELGCLPQDPAQRALFYLLAGEREKYERLDFDHRLLTAVYDQAGRPLRLRVSAQLRRFGRLDWTQVLETGRQTRWAADMTDADWETALQALSVPERAADLWRLAQAAPPVWGARAVLALPGLGWAPAPDDAASFALLHQQAAACSRVLPGVSLRYELRSSPNDIGALAYCPAAGLLVCASSDLSLQLRDAASGQLLGSLAGLRGRVSALACSPDGEYLAAATDKNTIDLYRRKDLALVKTFSGHKAIVRSLAVDPDGRTLASGSFDQTIKLWRFPHGQEIRTLASRGAEIFSIDIAASGKYLLSGSADGALAVWEMPAGNFLTAAAAHAGTITCAAFSPDLSFAASAGRDRAGHDRVVRLWTVPDLSPRSVLGPLDATATALAVFPRQPFLAAAGLDGALQLWNTTTAKLLTRFSAHAGAVTALICANAGAGPADAALITSGADQTLRCWDLSTLLLAHTPPEQVDFAAAARVGERLQGLPGQGRTEHGRTEHGSPDETRWLSFIHSLLQLRRRFDIVIEEPARISTGAFDIEL